MKDDADGGTAYADRLITLAGLVLLVFTVATVLLAPWLVDLYATSAYDDSQRALATAFARLCLPQIFFYGVYALLSQVLNARGYFGAPMFAPILNNVVAIASFMLFLAIAGTSAAADGVLTPDQIAILGIGTTLGVALQALILVPVALWIYTLVFAFSSLWFAHFALSALQQLRSRDEFMSTAGTAVEVPVLPTVPATEPLTPLP